MSLSVGSFSQFPFYPVLAPDATNFGTLTNNAAASKVFEYLNIQNARTGQGNPLIARLRNLQLATPSAGGLNLQLSADGYNSPTIDGIAAVKIAPHDLAYNDAWRSVAGQTLRLTAQNTTGADISNQWFSWGVEIETPTIAQIQQLQTPLGTLPALTEAQQALADKYETGARGVLPRTLDWIIANEYLTQVIDAPVLGDTQTVGTTGPVTFVTEQPKAGEMLVLRALWCSPGSGSDGLTVQVGVDDNLDTYSISAYGLGEGVSQPCFIQAAKQINLQMTATTQATGVTLSAIVWHVRLTPEIIARMAGDTSSATGAKLYVGVV